MVAANYANLNGNSRSGLPVARRSALANAGASGGNPGSPMPLGGSSLGTICTLTIGASGIRSGGKSWKLLCLPTPSLIMTASKRCAAHDALAHDPVLPRKCGAVFTVTNFGAMHDQWSVIAQLHVI